MNKEYEYSFKVTSIDNYLEYCKNNDYKLEEEYNQTRTLYKNNSKIMARITKNEYEKNSIEILNFKDNNENNETLKVCRESKDLIITNDNKEFVESLINILDLKEDKVLKRKRYVYTKNNVKFEIDKYTSPKMNVIGIEGLKKEVDKVYKELDKIIKNTKVK